MDFPQKDHYLSKSSEIVFSFKISETSSIPEPLSIRTKVEELARASPTSAEEGLPDNAYV